MRLAAKKDKVKRAILQDKRAQRIKAYGISQSLKKCDAHTVQEKTAEAKATLETYHQPAEDS